MSKCKLTGKSPQFGNNRPWSRKATRRTWQPNIQKFTLYVPELGKSVSLRISTTALKTINKIGLPAYLRKQELTLKEVT